MEQVHYDGVIPGHMLLPRLQTGDLIRLSVGFGHLHVGLLVLPVEVFTQEIQDGVDALLGVMLAMTLELLSILAEELLELDGADHGIVLVPHLVEELGVGLGETAFGAERVLRVQILLEFTVEEVSGQFPSVAQTLETTVHIASITQVSESHLSILSSRRPVKCRILQVLVHECAAVRLMEVFIFVFASFRAVFDSFAYTFELQYLFLITKFTFSHRHSLILLKSKSK